jgi:dihydroorotase
MNPPVRDLRHRDVIRQALVDGVLTCIGSDHAPHTLDEKARPYPDSPSGIPGVQTILPLLLTAVRDGWLRLEDIARVAARAPALVYGITGKGDVLPGCDGDLAIVDPSVRVPLPLSWLHSRAGYSPYEGTVLSGWPRQVVLRGTVAYENHVPVGPAQGQPLRYG